MRANAVTAVRCRVPGMTCVRVAVEIDEASRMPMGVFGASASAVNVGAAAVLAFSARGWSEIVNTATRRCVGCVPAATSRP
jgi:hypothetical protein